MQVGHAGCRFFGVANTLTGFIIRGESDGGGVAIGSVVVPEALSYVKPP